MQVNGRMLDRTLGALRLRSLRLERVFAGWEDVDRRRYVYEAVGEPLDATESLRMSGPQPTLRAALIELAAQCKEKDDERNQDE